MKIAIMQPYFFPYVGYWQLINEVDVFVIFDDVNFIKRGFINRNNILVNGKEQKITLELKGASQNKFINEIEVGNNSNKLLKTIEMAYKKAEYFDEVFPILSSIINSNEKNLALYLEKILREISSYLNYDTKFIRSSDLKNNKSLKAQDKIIDICRILKAKEYLNLPGGKELYDENDFIKNDIMLKFIVPKIEKYKQFNNEFISHLSIIDYIMFNGKGK